MKRKLTNIKGSAAAIAMVALLISPFAYAQGLTPIKNNGYRFVTKQYEKPEVLVKLVTFKTREEFRAEARKRGITNDSIAAFSVLSTKKDECTIYIIDPLTKFNPEMVGHEMLHCFYGQWHLNNELK